MQQRDEERQVTHRPRSTASHGARRMAGSAAALALALFGAVAVAGAGCGDEDSTDIDNGGSGGTAGRAGNGGTAGTAGTSGAAGNGGTAGSAGTAGAAGAAGTAGAAGAGGNGGTGDLPDAGGDAAVSDAGPTTLPFPPDRALTNEEIAFYICGREDELDDCDAADGCEGLAGFLDFAAENFEPECASDTLEFLECMARQDTSSYRCVGDPPSADFNLSTVDYGDGEFGSNGCEDLEEEFIAAQSGTGCD